MQRVVEHEDEREEFLDGYKYSGHEEVGNHYMYLYISKYATLGHQNFFGRQACVFS